MTDLFSIFFWLDLVDIATVGVLLWLAIRFVRRTRGRRALIGLTLLGGVYLLASALDLQLTASLFQGFFAVLVLVIVVVFQEDLRRLFEQLGTLRRGGARDRRGVDTADVIVRAVARLAANARRGADRAAAARADREPRRGRHRARRTALRAAAALALRSQLAGPRRRGDPARRADRALRRTPAAVGEPRRARSGRHAARGGARPLGALRRHLHRGLGRARHGLGRARRR